MDQAVHAKVQELAAGLGRADWAALADHGERLRHLVAAVPAAAWHKLSHSVAAYYHEMAARYGRPTADAILAAGVVGSAFPIPGATFAAMAPVIALAELHHRLAASPAAAEAADAVRLAESEIRNLGSLWLQDLAEVAGHP